MISFVTDGHYCGLSSGQSGGATIRNPAYSPSVTTAQAVGVAGEPSIESLSPSNASSAEGLAPLVGAKNTELVPEVVAGEGLVPSATAGSD